MDKNVKNFFENVQILTPGDSIHISENGKREVKRSGNMTEEKRIELTNQVLKNLGYSEPE